MKRWKWFLSLALSLCLLASLPGLSLAADEQQPDGGYTYTVRIYAGQQGTYQGREVVEFNGCCPGQEITFNLRDMQLNNNSKYYVKGIRESGRDDEANSSFKVDGDVDYVVVYGVLGNMTSYVIRYEDEAGNTLAPEETYYGNVDDKPVIAYLYIEGYQPQAYNLTKTLSANAAENVFTFVYTPVPTGGPVTPVTPVTPPATEESGAGAEDVGGGDAPAPAPAPGPDEPVVDDPGVVIDDPDVPLAPDDIQDLDEIPDDEVPLSNDGNNGDPGFLTAIVGEATLLGIPVGIVGAAVVAIGGVILWYTLVYMKKKKKEKVQ